ncbi:hypothetical protein C3K47_17595 [Solitalea longa]|uniref:Outer membrane protein beta-barrel domain-containing protein n=1 Tax=Solitalea longa TaxID=2079460 RepID=A0A2S4ZY40_9SPHI|nr:outer membrane beta-barrel protein [Solitalea longa]POY34917.1 hypothetical protein C3K47_17595 [Solitalea longa]
MKKYLLLLVLFTITCFSASAQFRYNRFSATISAGASRANMDAANGDVNFNLGLSAEYHFTPFTNFSLNYNDGKFSKMTPDLYGRAFVSDYSTISGSVNMSIGEIIHPWWKETHGFWNNIYFGAGIGMVSSKMNEYNNITVDGGFSPIGAAKYSGTNAFIPINAGINFKFNEFGLETPIEINMNMQHCIGLTDNIDGYNPSFDNKYSDAFDILTIGLRYTFGPEKVYYSWR